MRNKWKCGSTAEKKKDSWVMWQLKKLVSKGKISSTGYNQRVECARQISANDEGYTESQRFLRYLRD